MIPKAEMNEAEIRLHYIDPAIFRTWSKDCVRLEFPVHLGRIIVDGKKAKRATVKNPDYVLFHNNAGQWLPLAIVEAKDNNHTVLAGMGQARKYAKMMKAPFAFSTNGDAFAMYDMETGEETTLGNYIPMDQFPSPDELWNRYRLEHGITPAAEELLSVPYHYEEDMHEPRYYQWIAINKVIEAIANGRQRMLICLATGTGKTLVAFHIFWRLLAAKRVKRVLFLADRDVLVSDPMLHDFAPFKNRMYRIQNRKMDKNHEVYLSLYHQLKNGEENYYTAYDRDFFDLVIVDECHRGSADEDSSWHQILEYFDSAIQIGMTATPKETKDTSNIEYFGEAGDTEPLYTYTLKQGIQDGFLAPYKVIRVNLDIDVNGWRPAPGQYDLDGKLIPDRIYEQEDFDKDIVVAERNRIVAKRITDFLTETDRMAKVILFCHDIPHAERMKGELNNLNRDIVVEHSNYIAQITSGSEDKDQLEFFMGPYEQYPVIAITSKLMSTGVNTQTVKVIALDRVIGSMTEFKQIIGRGTRVKEECDKMFFTILDFRKNYTKFADPEFDGEPTKIKDVGENDDFTDDNENAGETDNGRTGDDEGADDDNGSEDDSGWPGSDDGDDGDGGSWDGKTDGRKRRKRERYHVNGIRVEIINEYVQYLDANGNLITTSIIEYSRGNLRRLYPYFEEFRKVWLAEKKKQELLQRLLDDGVFIDYVRDTLSREHFDDYDVLSYIGYEMTPLTKEERIEHILASGYLDKFAQENRDIINLLLEAYREHDIDELKSMRILSMPQFVQKGPVPAIIGRFGGRDRYIETINEIEQQLYSA